MASRKEVMQNLAKIEAKNLRKIATKEELNKLNLSRFNPETPTDCIYGQMTGDCYSERAGELIEKCCERVYKPEGTPKNCKLNGAPVGNRNNTHSTYRKIKYWSSLEVFIQQPKNQENGNNKRLIEYLKGEKASLKFA